jgi:predicted adenylyl cyclase CyaB
MQLLNVEFKAKVDGIQTYEDMLKTLNPEFIGTDRQVDTYFNVARGRLKLREGNIEQALIHYDRADTAAAKTSQVLLYRSHPDRALKDILIMHLGVKTVVDKLRRIYFIDNVKFHFDRVEGLGEFLEVEAIDNEGKFTREQLQAQCDLYFSFFGLSASMLREKSYSDMITIRASGQ